MKENSRRRSVRKICAACGQPIEIDDYFELIDFQDSKRKAYRIGSISCLLAKVSELTDDPSRFSELLRRFLVELKPASYIT